VKWLYEVTAAILEKAGGLFAKESDADIKDPYWGERVLRSAV
jgi:hypothetical protein